MGIRIQKLEVVIEQARSGLDQCDHMYGAYDLRNDLAEDAKSWASSKLADWKIAFGHSDSDIMERSTRLARFATNRPMIISYYEAHHIVDVDC